MNNERLKDIKVVLRLDTTQFKANLSSAIGEAKAQLASLSREMNTISTRGVAGLQTSLNKLKMPTLSGKTGTSGYITESKYTTGMLNGIATGSVAAASGLSSVEAGVVGVGAASVATSTSVNKLFQSENFKAFYEGKALPHMPSITRDPAQMTLAFETSMRKTKAITASATNEISRSFKHMGTSIATTFENIDAASFKSNITMKQLAKGSVIALAAVGLAMGKVLKKYDQQERAETSLLVATKNRLGETMRLRSLAATLQGKTRYGDEETIAAEAALAKMGLEESAIKRLIPLVQDLATIQHMSLATAADLVAKSVGSSTNALSRYAITMSGAVGSAERLNTAIYSLNEQVGGQAEAAAKVGIGAWVQLKNAWGDLLEAFGRRIPPQISQLAKLLTKLLGTTDVTSLKEADAGLTKWSKKLGEAKDALKQYNTHSKIWSDFHLKQKSLLDQDLKIANERVAYFAKIAAGYRQTTDEIKKNTIALGGNIKVQETSIKVDDKPDTSNLPEFKVPNETGRIKDLERNIASYTKLRAAAYDPTIIRQYTTAIESLQAALDKLTGTQKKQETESITWAQVAAQAFSQLGSAISQSFEQIGEALVKTDKAGAHLGKGLLSALGGFLSSFGAMLVQFGVGAIALGLGITAITKLSGPAAIAAGFEMVAAGAALSVVGGAIKGLGSNPTGASSVSSASSSSNCSLPSPYDYDRSMEFKIRGGDLVAVTNRYNSNNPGGR